MRTGIDEGQMAQAAAILRQGGLVAFPTETVYGLGANALDEVAVAGIFQAKGRPQDNPLIVHVAEQEQLYDLVQSVPSCARDLIGRFWPGPLSLIFKKAPQVPLRTTGGLDTVAIRMPDHPVALKLIAEAQVPVAAPSANVSGRPSPTTAAQSQGPGEELIVSSMVAPRSGWSTVLDLTSTPPMVLRPGCNRRRAEEILGPVDLDPPWRKSARCASPVRLG